ncbi:MAG: 2-oxo-hepta-3-ene-1,7-dioic acid hydratase [Halopseudomonas aestusnigri]
MNTEEYELAANALLKAEAEAKPTQRISERWPNVTLDDAYAISALVVEKKLSQGQRLIGHKVGLTSKAMQVASKIDEPDYGHVFDSMLIPNGGRVAHSNFCVPRVEPELTFVLKAPLQGPGLTMVDILRATEYVVPSIEIIDARVEEPRKIFDTVSDNGAGAGLILGGRPCKPNDVDLARVGAALIRNQEIEETGLAMGVLTHPAASVAWLANKLSETGRSMEPGHLILSGSFTRPVWVNAGDTITADFGPLGLVSVNFS